MNMVHEEIAEVTTLPDLVQVPWARGNVMPDMASMSDDFPAL
jgi:hypothetical protein